MSTTMFDNRISRAIDAMQIRYDDASDEGREAIADAATMTTSDLLTLGDLPTRGLLAGRLSADEANRLHAIHRSWSDATTAERVVFIQSCFELLNGGI